MMPALSSAAHGQICARLWPSAQKPGFPKALHPLVAARRDERKAEHEAYHS